MPEQVIRYEKTTLPLILLLFVVGCTGVKLPPESTNKLPDDRLARKIELIKDCFERQDSRRAAELSAELCDLGRAAGDNRAYLYGLVYFAQSRYLSTGEIDTLCGVIGEALALAERQKDYWALATLQNLLGIYMLFQKNDYGKGLSHLMKGLRYAESSGDASRIFPIKSNIALAYYFHNDPAGLRYAVDVYESGRNDHNEFMIFTGAVISSYMYHMLGKDSLALKYIEYALPLAETYSDQRGVYSQYGDILMSLGSEEEAARSYTKALSEGNDRGRFSDIDAHLGYGLYLKGKGRLEEALEMMREGVASIGSDSRSQKLYLLYYNISSLCESLNDPAAALHYYKLYHAESDSLFNIRQEKAIANLKIGYEKERYENELHLQKLRWQKRLQIVALLFAITALLAAGVFVLYYRKREAYRQILKLRQESTERERWYRTQLQRYTGESRVDVNLDTSAGRKDKQLYGLFTRLQELMTARRIYRQHDLSRDAVAKMLSTNRTYLSQAISQYTGLSFVYYVNSFRLEEAIRMLSDPDDETPIKAMVQELGFHSLSTFYRLFLATKGVPPSQFREECKSRRSRP